MEYPPDGATTMSELGGIEIDLEVYKAIELERRSFS